MSRYVLACLLCPPGQVVPVPVGWGVSNISVWRVELGRLVH